MNKRVFIYIFTAVVILAAALLLQKFYSNQVAQYEEGAARKLEANISDTIMSDPDVPSQVKKEFEYLKYEATGQSEQK